VVVQWQDRTWFCGGENYSDAYHAFDDVWVSGTGYNTTTWSLVTETPAWSGRAYHAGLVVTTGVAAGVPGGLWLITGGGICAGPFNTSICHGYTWNADAWVSADGANWTRIANGGSVSPSTTVGSAPVWWKAVGGKAAAAGRRAHRMGGGSACSVPRIDAPGSTMWCPRGGHTLNLMPDGVTLLLTGGLNNTAQLSDVWSSPDGGASWDLVTAAAPWPARSFHAGATLGSTLYICGGGNFEDIFGDVWSTPDGAAWTQVSAAAAWPARYAHNLVVQAGALLVIAGFTGFTSTGTVDVWASTDAASTWVEATANTTWAPRSFQAAALLPTTGALCVYGGWVLQLQPPPAYYDYLYYNDLWCTPPPA